VPLSVGAAGSPSNTMLPSPRPTSVPSVILIHPVVWSPQYTNVLTGLRSHSMGQTVTCNGRQKIFLGSIPPYSHRDAPPFTLVFVIVTYEHTSTLAHP